MSKKTELIKEIKSMLSPGHKKEPEYCIRFEGLCYTLEDFDFTNWKPIQKEVGKKINIEGQIFKIGQVDVFF